MTGIEHLLKVCLLFACKESDACYILSLMGAASPESISCSRAVKLMKPKLMQANTSLNSDSKLASCDRSSSLSSGENL